MEIERRASTPEDDGVLFELFCSAHQHKFSAMELPADQLEQLLRIQFEGQRRDFQQRYPDADFDLISQSGAVIGQWFVCRRPDHFLVVDITFLHGHRTGIATQIVRDLLDEAHREGKAVRAHVEAMNPARQLWLRLGFQRVGGDEAYWALECHPPSTAAPK
jgi:GNAT superfamily N-acetyltransferase